MSVIVVACGRCNGPVPIPIAVGWNTCSRCGNTVRDSDRLPAYESVDQARRLTSSPTAKTIALRPGAAIPTARSRGQTVFAIALGFLIVAATVAALLWMRTS